MRELQFLYLNCFGLNHHDGMPVFYTRPDENGHVEPHSNLTFDCNFDIDDRPPWYFGSCKACNGVIGKWILYVQRLMMDGFDLVIFVFSFLQRKN